MVFASSSYVKAYEDDDFEYPDASGTTLAKTSVNLYITKDNGASDKVALVNAPDLYNYYFDYECNNPSLGFSCYLDVTTKEIFFDVDGAGSGRVTFTLNNKELYLDIIVKQVKINKTSLLLVKKKKATLKVKGYSGKLKWFTNNKKSVKVNSKGVVKGKKIGNALIYAQVGTNYVGCAVSVISKKMKTVISKAKSLYKGKYSQPKRMQKGYYDCSSLVWRSYKKAKIYLVTKNYAPVAADLAKYYVKVKKKKIKGGYTSKKVAKMKLLPGDLYFWTGAKNGRYRGIFHVEMMTGYRCIGFDGNTAIIVARWATKRDGNYMKEKGLMVRPYKQK